MFGLTPATAIIEKQLRRLFVKWLRFLTSQNPLSWYSTGCGKQALLGHWYHRSRIVSRNRSAHLLQVFLIVIFSFIFIDG